MTNKKYDDLIRALVPRQPNPQPSGPQPGQGPPVIMYPGQQPYNPPGPVYIGQAPIQPPVYRAEPPYTPDPYPVEPWPPMPPRQPRPKSSGPSGLDVAMILLCAGCFIIFLAALLPG